MKRCSACGVPRKITSTHRWLDNGTMVETNNPDHRMIFIESDNIGGVFTRIEEILGLPIEHLVIESQRRMTYDYVRSLMPSMVLKLFRMTSIRPLAKSVTELGRLVGLGDVELLSMRIKGDEGDYVKLGGRNLFYIPAYCGMVVGSMEALSGQECSISYEETSPGYYEVTTSVTTHPVELKERFKPREYSRKEGDLRLPRCSRCGGPSALAGYDFLYDEGIILHRANARRMLFDGPAEFEAIFSELEKELGEDIPQVIIEAQKLFVKSGFYDLGEIMDTDAFREHLALRGLGNLRDMEYGEDHLRLRIENPCLHLLLAGLAQGVFELASDREARVAWELAGDGDLTVEAS
ncbi:MAG: hypothetical protein PHP28_01920 [Actinomycetota bacterium]|nr:hypothetical protein [Actinomycetota bacterium]MDD5667686.1 hypothetical protein [Actinomycetota bacterium]